jgi:hypothetical protein
VSVSVVAENFRDEKSSNVSLEKFFNEEKLEFSNNLLTHLPKKDLSSSLKTIKFFFPQNNNNIGSSNNNSNNQPTKRKKSFKKKLLGSQKNRKNSEKSDRMFQSVFSLEKG